MLKVEELLQKCMHQGASATVPGMVALSALTDDNLIVWRSDEGDGSDESVRIPGFCSISKYSIPQRLPSMQSGVGFDKRRTDLPLSKSRNVFGFSTFRVLAEG